MKLIWTLLLLSLNFATAETNSVVLQNVTVIDGTAATGKSGIDVVITADRITDVAKSGNVNIPKDATVIDGTGKYLIPGLWDMHVHWYHEAYLSLFLANGVTGVRIMWGMPMHFDWRKRIQDGTLIGPRLITASAIIDGPNPFWPGSVTVGTAEEARKAVRNAKISGADFIKVYSFLPREAYFAIAQESNSEGIPFAGHVPNSVSAMEASDAGQKSIEHLTGVLLACSTEEEKIRPLYVQTLTQDKRQAMALLRKTGISLAQTYNERKCDTLFSHFVKNHTWQCPTLTVLNNMANLNDPNLANDPRLKYMPREIRQQWNPKNDFRMKEMTAEDYSNGKKVFAKQLQIAGSMHRSGVKLLAGTDTLNPYCFPGFSLHDELKWMVQAGLTPMEALRTATYNAAEYLGMLDSYGTIEKGKVADLVLLNADPLQDISNTKQIDSVIFGGRLFRSDDLKKLKADVEKLAEASAQTQTTKSSE